MDEQPMEGEPPVDYEPVIGDIAHVSKPMNQTQDKLQVLDYETGNLVSAKESECDMVEQTVDDEPPVEPVVAHVSEPVTQKIVANANVHQHLLTQDDPQILDYDPGHLVPAKVNESDMVEQTINWCLLFIEKRDYKDR
jgi:hypothetical protein